MGNMRNAYIILVGRSEGRRLRGSSRCRIILEWILRRQDGKVWSGCIWLRIGISSWLF
jgi:hypothetical protein